MSISQITSDGLDLWPLFQSEWYSSISGPRLIENLLKLNLFESVMAEMPEQRIGIYLLEQQSWEYALLTAWRAAGHKKIIGAQHATFLYWDLRNFFDPRSYQRQSGKDLPLPDLIAVNGPQSLSTLISAGYPENLLRSVEALRYMHLDSDPTLGKQMFHSSSASFRLLVLGDYLRKNVDLQMELLQQAFPYFPSTVEVVFKAHPYCPITVADFPGIPMEVSAKEIAQLLSECDAAYTSAATSAAMDAYCARVPVVSLANPSELNMSPLRGRKDVRFASSGEELSDWLNELIISRTTATTPDVIFNIDAQLPEWLSLLRE